MADQACYNATISYMWRRNYLSINQFSCMTNKSVLTVQAGLAASGAGSRQRFVCNQQYGPIPVVWKHHFARVDIYLDVLDPSIKFQMNLTEINTSQNIKMNEVDRRGIISSVYNLDSPLIYYSINSYLSLTVTSFSYTGPHWNVKADRVHQLTPPDGQEQTAYLPKGRFVYTIFNLIIPQIDILQCYWLIKSAINMSITHLNMQYILYYAEGF
jgi:hypothetical protein